jgi:hypothetical protein
LVFPNPIDHPHGIDPWKDSRSGSTRPAQDRAAESSNSVRHICQAKLGATQEKSAPRSPQAVSARSLRQVTPPSHSAKPLRQVAPPSRSAKSLRQVTPPGHSAKSLRQATPPSHSAKPLRQVTPPSHSAKSHRQATLPRGEGGERPGEGLRGRWQRRGKTAVESEGAFPSKSESPRSEPVGLVLPAQAEGLGFGPQIAPAL